MITLDALDPDWLGDQLVGMDIDNIWIGLHEDPEQESVWRWINVKTGEGLTGDDISQSKNWATTVQDGDSCGYFNTSTKKWYSTDCSQKLYFACYGDDLVLVTENKTWEEALNHCSQMTTRTYKYDLLSLTDSSDFSYVRDRIYKANTKEVWTGLRFLGGEWLWADGEALNHQEMLPDCPIQWKHCGTISKYETDNWITRDCSERRSFICHGKEIQ